MSGRGLLVVLALGLAGSASAVNVGTGGAQFLTIEQGARGLGMGGAFASVADDAGALWWNPAGLARVDSKQATFSHTAYIENVATEYAGFVMPYAPAHGAFGASFTYLSVPGLDGYDASGNPTGSLSAGGYVGALSYGASLFPGLTAGLTAKFIQQKLASDSGTDYAFDGGAQYRADSYGLGIAVQNYGKPFKIGDATDPLPEAIRGGGFYKPIPKVLVSLEEEKPYADLARLHFGAEWDVMDGVDLRAGFQQTPNSGSGAGFTVGFGLASAFGGSQIVPAGGTADERNADVSVARPFWEHLAGNSRDLKTALQEGAVIVGIDYAFVSNGDLTDVHRLTLNVKF